MIITFEEFKEVILPYRITDEPLLYSKTELQRKFYPILSLEGMDKITVPIERYKMYILKQQRISYYTQEVIPEVLSLPTLQDETFRYHQTVSLRLPFDIQTNNKLAYLSFVTRSGIVPIGWGEIDAEKKMAMFHQVPLAMTFILSYYDGDSLKAVGEPFRLIPEEELKELPRPLAARRNEPIVTLTWNGKKLLQADKEIKSILYKEYKCDTMRHIDIRLLRKYPPKPHLLKLHKQLKGAYILGSTSLNGKVDTVAVLSETPQPVWQTINVKRNKKYRYLSFHTRNRRPLNIAEIEFFGNTPTLVQTNTLEKLDILADEPYWNAIDEDVETFIVTPVMNIKLKKPAIIKAIRFIPRNSNNMVNEGERKNYLLHIIKADKRGYPSNQFKK